MDKETDAIVKFEMIGLVIAFMAMLFYIVVGACVILVAFKFVGLI